MTDEVPGALAEYITLDEVAMALAKMRVHKTVRNAPKEFLLRFFETGYKSKNKGAACSYLPHRRQWIRPSAKMRGHLDSSKIQVASIMRCVRAYARAGTLDSTEWGRNLVGLLADIRRSVAQRTFVFASPRKALVPKLTIQGKQESREISIFDDPADAVLLSRTAAYLRDWFEPVLKEGKCCYSFRKSRKLTHQRAVAELCRWREAHSDVPLFVAECDIRKFFDNIRHDEVLKALDRYAAERGGLDSAAREVVVAYLDCYRYGERDGMPHGIPQGGPLSPVLANMVMAQADAAVLKHVSEELFYARYCDDMVLVSTSESLCGRAMDAYLHVLETLRLPPHPVTDFTYGEDYFTAKSKGPFCWRRTEKGTRGCAEWVAFLGNQVRYDGAVRVRFDTVRKHVLNLKKEVGRAIGLLETWNRPIRKGIGAERFYAAFRRHLVAKGVGYVRAGVIPKKRRSRVKKSLCWAAAFPSLTPDAVCGRQMRMLDFVRERALGALRRVLGLKGRKMRFLGHPFSYLGFLERAERPNMGRRRVAVLPYSEL